MGLSIASLAVMPALGMAKRRLGARLDSAATAGEGNQNLLCAYLAAAVLVGLLANTLGSTRSSPSPSPASPYAKASRHGKAKTAADSHRRRGTSVLRFGFEVGAPADVVHRPADDRVETAVGVLHLLQQVLNTAVASYRDSELLMCHRPAWHPRRPGADPPGQAGWVTAVVGSGIMAARLSPHDLGVQFLENAQSTWGAQSRQCDADEPADRGLGS
jgi:hypothetical protein